MKTPVLVLFPIGEITHQSAEQLKMSGVGTMYAPGSCFKDKKVSLYDQSTVQNLIARIEELEKQAKHYRALIDKMEYDGHGWWLPEVCLKVSDAPPTFEEANRSIDNYFKE